MDKQLNWSLRFLALFAERRSVIAESYFAVDKEALEKFKLLCWRISNLQSTSGNLLSIKWSALVAYAALTRNVLMSDVSHEHRPMPIIVLVRTSLLVLKKILNIPYGQNLIRKRLRDNVRICIIITWSLLSDKIKVAFFEDIVQISWESKCFVSFK